MIFDNKNYDNHKTFVWGFVLNHFFFFFKKKNLKKFVQYPYTPVVFYEPKALIEVLQFLVQNNFLQIDMTIYVTLMTSSTKQLNLPVKFYCLIFFTHVASGSTRVNSRLA